jgi:predicted nuclease with TOPRIM domain
MRLEELIDKYDADTEVNMFVSNFALGAEQLGKDLKEAREIKAKYAQLCADYDKTKADYTRSQAENARFQADYARSQAEVEALKAEIARLTGRKQT